jgi:hypothetical protein
MAGIITSEAKLTEKLLPVAALLLRAFDSLYVGLRRPRGRAFSSVVGG